MKINRNLGIWMDHSIANLIDLTAVENCRSIESNFTFETKVEALNRSEDIMHNKEQQMHNAFYKEISKAILAYDHVLLFGPTQAKFELKNYLKMDLNFKDIIIDVEAADKMTNNERNDYVKIHFGVEKV
ncbi:MAG: hypothetical protein SGJ00_05555 [bacterium]|nr:hypothetical protein [bacterium]